MSSYIHFVKLHSNINAEFSKFSEKLKDTTDRVLELEKGMAHFEEEQLEIKENTIPWVQDEVKAVHNKVLALNLWVPFYHGFSIRFNPATKAIKSFL